MLTDTDLKALRDAGLLDDAKLAEIDAFLRGQKQAPVTPVIGANLPRFDLTHVLWYAGALIIMGAMGLFTNEAFNRMGGWALVACGSAYAVAFLTAGHLLWKNHSLRIPAGLLIAVSVSMVPMIIYGVQDAHDLWKSALGDPGQYQNLVPSVNGSWI